MGDTAKWVLQRATGSGDSNDTDEPDTEQKGDYEDEEDEDDEMEEKANPIDRAVSEGVIEAARAPEFRELSSKMDSEVVEMIVEKVSDGELDMDEAATLLDAKGGGGAEDMEKADTDETEERADTTEDDTKIETKMTPEEVAEAFAEQYGIPEDEAMELVAQVDAGGADEEKDAPGELKSKLDDLGSSEDRLDSIEEKLDEIAEAAVTEDTLEQRLEDAEVDTETVEQKAAEQAKEQLDDLLQKGEVVATPSPTTGEPNGPSLRSSLEQAGGDN